MIIKNNEVAVDEMIELTGMISKIQDDGRENGGKECV
jgi:hypothetical protein